MLGSTEGCVLACPGSCCHLLPGLIPRAPFTHLLLGVPGWSRRSPSTSSLPGQPLPGPLHAQGIVGQGHLSPWAWPHLPTQRPTGCRHTGAAPSWQRRARTWRPVPWCMVAGTPVSPSCLSLRGKGGGTSCALRLPQEEAGPHLEVLPQPLPWLEGAPGHLGVTRPHHRWAGDPARRCTPGFLLGRTL